MHPRYPGRRHWSAVKRIQIELPQMTPHEFLVYWDVTYSELAVICFCSEKTVKRWFSGSHPPTIFQKFWLASTHNIWSRL